MKALKVKSILFSLLAVMAVAVFLTSCEQELLPVADTIETPIEGTKTQFLFQELQALVPNDINLQDQEAVDALVSQLDGSMLEKLIEGTAITNYLISKNLAKDYLSTDNPSQVKIPKISDFEHLLSAEDIEEINNKIEASASLKSNCSESWAVVGYESCWVQFIGWFPCAPIDGYSLSCSSNTVVLYEGNDITQDIVGIIDVHYNRNIRFKSHSCCPNDEARSAKLWNMKAGQKIIFFDDSDPTGTYSDTKDDYTSIEIKRNFDSKAINSFQPNDEWTFSYPINGWVFNDNDIKMVHKKGGNLDGKVSHFKCRN